MPLGWAIIGDCCLGKFPRPSVIVANKTHILASGQGTTFSTCPTHLKVTETLYNPNVEVTHSQDTIFLRTSEDDQPGLLVEDREFLQIMDKHCYRDEDGHWTAPLPFRKNRSSLPNNRNQAVRRMRSLISSFKKKKHQTRSCYHIHGVSSKKGHAEKAPTLEGEGLWYLPTFVVYHLRKPTQIRMVFDASASFAGKSLNSILLPGPNLTNSLLGILLRFRKKRVAVIEQMFHSFRITEDHRNCVRFIWFEDNDPPKPLTGYRMCVHLFGNSPSPVVATYLLQKRVSDDSCDIDIQEFVTKNFYVDDSLALFPLKGEAMDVLLRTHAKLMEEGQLRFHKFASNSQLVVNVLSILRDGQYSSHV